MVAQAKKTDRIVQMARSGQARALRQGQRTLRKRRKWRAEPCEAPTGATTPTAHGNTLSNPTCRRKTWTGIHGSGRRPEPRRPSTRSRCTLALLERIWNRRCRETCWFISYSACSLCWASMRPRNAFSAFGGIYHFKDGGTCRDVHPVLFEYGNIPVYIAVSLACESTEVTRFQGPKGAIEIREFECYVYSASWSRSLAELLYRVVSSQHAKCLCEAMA